MDFEKQITQYEPLLMRIPFISTYVFGKKHEILIVREDKPILWTFGYDREKYILLTTGEKFLKLGDYKLHPGELDLLFLVKYPVKDKVTGVVEDKFVLERGIVEYDLNAAAQIQEADKSKMSDRISERIFYSGLLKYAMPQDPFTLATFVISGFLCIIAIYFLMTNFGAIVDPIYRMAEQRLPQEVINATLK